MAAPVEDSEPLSDAARFAAAAITKDESYARRQRHKLDDFLTSLDDVDLRDEIVARLSRRDIPPKGIVDGLKAVCDFTVSEHTVAKWRDRHGI